MTVKEQIDAALQALFEAIRAANGYQTDAGAYVFRNLEYTEHPEAMPSLAWFPGELTSGLDGDTPPSLGEENHYYQVSVEGFIEDDKAGSEGERLRADLVRALRGDDTLGGLAEPLGEIKTSIAVQQGDEVFSCVQASFTVLYVTEWGEI